ncbi:MAG: hypothetical protein Q8R13_04570 [bacterium]|nr:hypothetical protein [bacterium]
MFKKLNHLLRVFGGRCIIVEDGEPRYVLISAEEFLTLTAGKTLQSGSVTPAALGEMPDQGAGMPIEDEDADISEGHVSRRRNGVTEDAAARSGAADEGGSRRRPTEDEAPLLPVTKAPSEYVPVEELTSEAAALAQVNREIGALNDVAAQVNLEEMPLGERKEKSEYKIEDIPF